MIYFFIISRFTYPICWISYHILKAMNTSVYVDKWFDSMTCVELWKDNLLYGVIIGLWQDDLCTAFDFLVCDHIYDRDNYCYNWHHDDFEGGFYLLVLSISWSWWYFCIPLIIHYWINWSHWRSYVILTYNMG